MDHLVRITEQLARLERIIEEDSRHVQKRLDELDEKLDTYHMETVQLKNDVSWIKGSGKIVVTIMVAAIGALITAFVKMIPIMGNEQIIK